MTKQKSIPEYVTREILKKEISASEKRLMSKIGDEIGGVEKRLTVKIGDEIGGVEKRLDVRIDTTSQSLKDYTDSRIAPVVDGIHRLEETVKQQGSKMDRYYEGIVKMMEGVTGRVAMADDRLKDHDVRITALEGRGPQASRI